MNVGRKSLTLVALVSTVGMSACTNSPSAGSSCESIDRAGGIVSSADGALSLSFRPDSISESTEVCISDAARPPNGPPNVYGQAYRVTPDIPLGVNISVTYRAPLPDDTSQAAVGVIRREDFDAGQGRWLALPITRLEPSNDLIAGTDTRLSMFYGLLSDGGSGPATPGSTTGTASSGTGTGTDSDTPTTDATDTAGSEESTTGVTESDSDSETNDPTSDSDETTGTSDSDSESDSDTGNPVDCDNLPSGPFDITQIGTVTPGTSEDLAMTGDGTFLLVEGDTIVEMDADGNTTEWLTGLPFEDGILGIAFDSYGTLFGAVGNNSGNLWSFTTAGSNELVDTGAGLSNGLFVDSDQQVWISDSEAGAILRVDPDAGTVVEVVTNNAGTANGLFVDENRSVLYWARFAQSQVYVAQLEGGVAGPALAVADLEGSSDGMTMDECGNLYVVGTQGGVYRIDLGVGGYPITLPAG